MEVDEALSVLESESMLHDYFTQEIVPHLSQFAKSYMEDIFTLGYNVSSPAESLNALIKHGSQSPKQMTMLQSRLDFISNLQTHSDLIANAINTHRHDPDFDQLYRHYYPTIALNLIQRMKISSTITIQDSEIQNGVYIAIDGKHEYILTKDTCSCYQLQQEGIPCVHLFALYEQIIKENPLTLVHPRWAKDCNGISDIHNFGRICDSSKTKYTVEALENMIKQLTPIEHPKNSLFDEYYEFEKLPSAIQFSKVQNMARDLCTSASNIGAPQLFVLHSMFGNLLNHLKDLQVAHPEFTQSFDDFLRLLEQETANQDDQILLTQAPMLQEEEPIYPPIVSHVTNISTIDHIDAPGRPKGRPKNPRTTTKGVKPSFCIICTGNHTPSKCKLYSEYKAFKQNQPLQQIGLRRCQVCHRYDHVESQCTLRRLAQLLQNTNPDPNEVEQLKDAINSELRSISAPNSNS